MNFNQVSVAKKFALLGIVALLMVVVPAFSQLRTAQRQIAAAQHELNGVIPAHQLLRLIQVTQQHRGLSAVFLGSNVQAQTRAAKNVQVNQAVLELDTLLTATELTDATSDWHQAKQEWQSLQASVQSHSLTAAESSTLHSFDCTLFEDARSNDDAVRTDPEARAGHVLSDDGQPHQAAARH